MLLPGRASKGCDQNFSDTLLNTDLCAPLHPWAMIVVDRKDQGFLVTFRIYIRSDLFQYFTGIIRKDYLTIEVSDFKIQLILQYSAINQLIGIGIIPSDRFAFRLVSSYTPFNYTTWHTISQSKYR